MGIGPRCFVDGFHPAIKYNGDNGIYFVTLKKFVKSAKAYLIQDIVTFIPLILVEILKNTGTLPMTKPPEMSA
jgi:hypothetical protein